jgi:predicted nucleotidyltransferase
MTRAKAAMDSGAELVLELPVHYALSSAEGFAAGGVNILSRICNHICFGAENADKDALLETAAALLSPAFPDALRTYLDAGLSFPVARQKALCSMGLESSLLETPNNILAVEYCKAILSQKSNMQPMPIYREGSYHSVLPNTENPSATFLRQQLRNKEDWQSFVPEEVKDLFATSPLHSLEAGERAILGKLRTMTDSEFEALPGGSEGLWRKLMYAARECSTLEEIAAYIKSKRYTRTRIDRMILCAFLGISEEMLHTPAPYVRVLALNDKGREILKLARQYGDFVNAGEKCEGDHAELETRCGRLYGLFAADQPEPPATEQSLRIYYHP